MIDVTNTNPLTGGIGATTGGIGDIAKGIGGIYDLITGVAGTDINRAREAANMADPFATQRGQYQTQLQQLLSDPNSFKTDPGYQFALGQGQQAVGNAADALYGTRRNGALAPELAKFTEGYASQSYDERIKQLMQLSGANSGSPGTAGTLLAGGFANNQNALAGGALGALAPLINQIAPGLLNGIGGLGSGIGNIGGAGIGNNGGIAGQNDLGEGNFNDLNNPWVTSGSNDLGEGNFGDLNNPWTGGFDLSDNWFNDIFGG